MPDLERHRVQALAAEGRGDWEKAERCWQTAAAAIVADGDDRQAMLSRGVILRHLTQLADKHPEIEGDGDGFFDDPVIFYLERSYQAAPDYVTAVLELIGHYRAESRLKDWHRLVDEAVQRFPDNSPLLLQATESAMARKAYKKAAGFAHRLLKIDPINSGVRRQMIELQVAHARKQMRSKRPDLAAKELAAAAEWERSDAPSAPLRIAQALVSPHRPESASPGVVAGGRGARRWRSRRLVPGALEGEFMKLTGGDAGWLRQELVRERETPPTKQAVMAIVSALGQPEAGENKRVVTSFLLGMRAWLLQAAVIDWRRPNSRLSPRSSPGSMRSICLRNTRGLRAGAIP